MKTKYICKKKNDSFDVIRIIKKENVYFYETYIAGFENELYATMYVVQKNFMQKYMNIIGR